MSNIIVFVMKFGLMAVGVVIFSFVSVIIISIETLSRLCDVLRDCRKVKVSA